MLDHQHRKRNYAPSEIEHRYGDHVHIMGDPVSLTQLARLCAQDTVQPEISRLVTALYQRLIVHAVNLEFPTRIMKVTSRMKEVLDKNGDDGQRGIIEADLIDAEVPVVTVDIARAGIVPSQICYETLNELMDPTLIRQDHLIVSRALDSANHVVGARIHGDKVGGPVDGRIVLFPDPMGATGSSLSTAISHYKNGVGGVPSKILTLNLIVTPEFIRKMTHDHPGVILFAFRLDRGMSSREVLDTVPGTHWDDEHGLDQHDYIVPGGGGFGEIMNNAWI